MAFSPPSPFVLEISLPLLGPWGHLQVKSLAAGLHLMGGGGVAGSTLRGAMGGLGSVPVSAVNLQRDLRQIISPPAYFAPELFGAGTGPVYLYSTERNRALILGGASRRC